MADFDVRIDAGGAAWSVNKLRIWVRNNRGDVPSLIAAGGAKVVVLRENEWPDEDAHFADLPYEAAQPLMAALSRHLGAVEHPEQLRADFDHLRKRHDLLVDYVLARSTMGVRRG